ncbi:porin family protein [Pontibacter rugosus]|uniref:Porin family protein n=1 Tax=Pontibacter rugosus TaxID=1745966 RepID=A0ABW3STP2_9BACT
MKKILLLLLLSIGTYTLNAQDTFVPETKLGVKGGVNLSSFSFNPSIDQTMTVGYTGGIVFKHINNPKLGIQAEINYLQRGWTETLVTGDTYTRDLQYVELPLMTHIAFGEKKTRYILNFGPNASYLLAGGEGVEGSDTGEGVIAYQNKEIDNPFMFGLSFGVGVVRKTGFGDFQLEARYTQSLSNIFRSDINLVASRNQSIGITLAYLVDFSGGKN